MLGTTVPVQRSNVDAATRSLGCRSLREAHRQALAVASGLARYGFWHGAAPQLKRMNIAALLSTLAVRLRRISG